MTDNKSLLVLSDRNDLGYKLVIGTQSFAIDNLFLTTERLHKLLLAIHNEVEGLVPDTSTAKGRAEIKSLAAKVASSKTLLDDIGKDAVADLKKKPALIDAARKVARDDLDALKIKIRQPLTDWEAEKEAEKVRVAAAAKYLVDWDMAIAENLLYDANERVRIAEAAAADARVEAKRQADMALFRVQAAAEATRIAERAAQVIEIPATSPRPQAVIAVDRVVSKECLEAADQVCGDRFGQEKEVSYERRSEVNRSVREKLEELGLSTGMATMIVVRIALGKIPNVSINYLEEKSDK